MNSIHDMGGMHGLGPILYEPDEPVFHARWEARVAALTGPMGAWARWTSDAFRYRIERMPAAEYLRSSYYEKWLTALTDLSLEAGLISGTELESGRPDPGCRETNAGPHTGAGESQPDQEPLVESA